MGLIEELVGQLRDRGFVLQRNVAPATLVDILEDLGQVLQVEDVVVDPRSASMVKSSSELSFHTDHYRAEAILWHCIAQCSVGGETLLVDARPAYESLASEDRALLEEITLSEHAVFRGDPSRRPVVTQSSRGPRFYYSFWLAEESMPARQRAAFDAFHAAVEAAPRTRLRLSPGDVLIIDNRRMLHARTAIEGDGLRHLRRYWFGYTALATENS